MAAVGHADVLALLELAGESGCVAVGLDLALGRRDAGQGTGATGPIPPRVMQGALKFSY